MSKATELLVGWKGPFEAFCYDGLWWHVRCGTTTILVQLDKQEAIFLAALLNSSSSLPELPMDLGWQGEFKAISSTIQNANGETIATVATHDEAIFLAALLNAAYPVPAAGGMR